MRFLLFFFFLHANQILAAQIKNPVINTNHKNSNHLKGAINDLISNMITIAGGSYIMGCSSNKYKKCIEDETLAHRVNLKNFKLSKFEVTLSQWLAVMGSTPVNSKEKCDDCPVEDVNWYEVQEFIHKLNKMTGKHFRLPTEAEWEYAARGGNKSKGYMYSGTNNLQMITNYGYRGSLPVGQRMPNELGLYDMTGNVWEWCSDWFSEAYYSISPSINPKGPSEGERKVVRGMYVPKEEQLSRVEKRYSYLPQNTLYFGFRLAQD